MPWVIVAAVLAVFALVAVGVGIGYSAWGSNASSSSAAPATRPSSRPTTPARPGTGAALPSGTAAKTAFLGVEIAAGGYVTGKSETSPGAHVIRVVTGSPAAHAGIKAGDIITGFGGRKVASGLTLHFDVTHDSPGQQVTVTWQTAQGTTHHATVKLAHRPTSQSVG